MNRAILPGATIGVLGSGQLGRMFAIAARRMGYRVHTLSPEDDTPTGHISDKEITASYDDLDAVRALARGVDVMTFEFENVPHAAAEAAAEYARRFIRDQVEGLRSEYPDPAALEQAFLSFGEYAIAPGFELKPWLAHCIATPATRR